MKKLLENLAAIDSKLDALLTVDELTDEQRAGHDKLVVERKKALTAIEREKDRVAREAERSKLAADAKAAEDARLAAEERDRLAATAPSPGRRTDPDVPAVNPGVTSAQDAPIPATVRQHGPIRNFVGVVGGREPRLRAYRFGQWALAQLSIQMPGRFRFKAAQDWVEKNMSASSTKDATGYSNLIPEEFGVDLIDLREKRGIVRQLFKNVPMMSDTRTDPRRQGGLTAYFVGESTAGTESNKAWDNVRLTAKDLMVLARYTNQLNADSVINIGDDLAGEIAYAFADKEDQCGLNGDGTSTYGGIVGVRSKLLSFDGAGTASAGVYQSANTGGYSALTLSDFQAVAGKLPQYADTPNVSWGVHRTFFYTVMQKLELAAGGVTANEVQTGDRRPRPLFLGYPVTFSQVMPSSTATSQVCALLGDFSMGASFGDRQQDDIAFSEHATIGGENVFERNQIAIRGTERIDINVHDVGDATNPGPIVALETASS